MRVSGATRKKRDRLHNASLFVASFSLSFSLFSCLRRHSRFIGGLTREIAIRVFARLSGTGTCIAAVADNRDPVLAAHSRSTYRNGCRQRTAALSRSFLEILLSRTILRFFFSRTCVAYPCAERASGAIALLESGNSRRVDRSKWRDAILRPWPAEEETHRRAMAVESSLPFIEIPATLSFGATKSGERSRAGAAEDNARISILSISCDETPSPTDLPISDMGSVYFQSLESKSKSKSTRNKRSRASLNSNRRFEQHRELASFPAFDSILIEPNYTRYFNIARSEVNRVLNCIRPFAPAIHSSKSALIPHSPDFWRERDRGLCQTDQTRLRVS